MLIQQQQLQQKKQRKKGKIEKNKKIKTAQIGRSLKIIGAANSSVFCTSFLLVASCIYIILQPVRFLYIYFIYVYVLVFPVSSGLLTLYNKLFISAE